MCRFCPEARGGGCSAAGLLRSAPVPLPRSGWRSEEHTSELQSRFDIVCRLLAPPHTYSLSLHYALPICKDVCRYTVLLYDDPVADAIRFKRHVAFDDIVECVGFVLRHAEADARLPAFCDQRLFLFLAQVGMLSTVTRHLTAGNLRFTLSFQFLGCHIAAVCLVL